MLLEQRILDLQKDKGALIDKVKEAKEIIKDYLTITKGAHTAVCGVPEENCTINVLKLNEEAEQFLKEIKEK